MASIPFIKAQGLGNDFVILESSLDQDLETLYSKEFLSHLANRRLGVGCDQIIIYHCLSKSDVKVAFFNADGTIASACGNGSRALISYLFQENLIISPMNLHAKGGVLQGELLKNSDGNMSVVLNFPHPKIIERDDLEKLPRVPGQREAYVYVEVGNPHLVCFTEDLDAINMEIWGPILSTHSIFKGDHPNEPSDVNVSFVYYREPSHLDLKVWERGAGFTGACGTAACATFAAFKAANHNPLNDVIQMHQEGGILQLIWTSSDIKMMGPTKMVFKGELELS